MIVSNTTPPSTPFSSIAPGGPFLDVQDPLNPVPLVKIGPTSGGENAARPSDGAVFTLPAAHPVVAAPNANLSYSPPSP